MVSESLLVSQQLAAGLAVAAHLRIVAPVELSVALLPVVQFAGPQSGAQDLAPATTNNCVR